MLHPLPNSSSVSLGSTPFHGLSPSNLLELCDAANHLRTRCSMLESANAELTALLRERESDVTRLRTNDLLLRKEALLWSSYCHLVWMPLHAAHLALVRRAMGEERQHAAQLVRAKQRDEAEACAAMGDGRRECLALRARLRQLHAEQDGAAEREAACAVRLANACAQVELLRRDLDACTRRTGDTCWCEAELAARDAHIAQLRGVVRELHARLLAQRGRDPPSRAPRQAGSIEREREEDRDDGDSSARLRRSIRRLQRQLTASPAQEEQRRRLFDQSNSPLSVDLEDFLEEELAAPVP